MNKVVIYGAGSIGCYLGTILKSQEVDVELLGRQRLKEIIAQSGGIHISDYEGRDNFVADVPYSTDVSILASADIVLVTLKCTAMREVAPILAEHCKTGAIVVCLQNGVGAEQPVVELVSQARVLCGIVPFNVVQGDNAHFHRATEGVLHLPNTPELKPVQRAFLGYGLPCELEDDMPAIIWGKLLLNLNNAINALSDLPLKTELSQRGYRLVLARCQEELLAVCRAKGIRLAKLTSVSPALIPKILRLPDFIFRILAQKMLAIDPKARSSMWEDIQAGRETEIDYLNGAVVTMAKGIGMEAPTNEKVSELLKQRASHKLSKGISASDMKQGLI